MHETTRELIERQAISWKGLVIQISITVTILFVTHWVDVSGEQK